MYSFCRLALIVMTLQSKKVNLQYIRLTIQILLLLTMEVAVFGYKIVSIEVVLMAAANQFVAMSSHQVRKLNYFTIIIS